MRMWKTGLTSILCLGFMAAAADTKQNSRQVTTADGLSGNTINEIVQDNEGFIWMATNNGLSRFDGYYIVNYTSLASDPKRQLSARIGRIFHDAARNLLWLNTATYQNACYDLQQARFTDWTGQGNQYRQQNKLMPTSRGMVLYGMKTGASLCCKTGNGQQVLDFSTSNGTMPSDDVLTVIEDSAHNIWLPTASGLAVLDPGGKMHIADRKTCHIAAATDGHTTYFLSKDGKARGYDEQRRMVMESQMPQPTGIPQKVNVSFVWQGRWMLFTTTGTYAMSLKTGAFEKPHQWQADNALNQGTCQGYHFVAGRTGSLWLFPDSGQVQQLDLIPASRHAVNKGWKYHVTRAHDGRLFIATYGAGLYVYDPASGMLNHYSADDPDAIIQTDYLLCAITDRQGCIWIGSESAGAYCLSMLDEKTASYSAPKPDSRGWCNNVSAMTRTSDGTVVLGTRDGGIYSYEQDSRQFHLIGESSTYATACLTDSNGRLWTGTKGEGLYVDGQQYCSSDSLHHLPGDDITCIMPVPDGNIWVGTWNDGLLMIDPHTLHVKAQVLTGSMNESRVNDFCLAPDNNQVWVATNNGIYLLSLSGKILEHHNTANGQFPSDEVNALLTDKQGTLWVATAGNGIVKRIQGDGTRMETITTREGLSNNNATSLVADRQGYIWVGTEDGISRINPRNNIVNSYHFATNLQSNTASNRCAMARSDGRLLFGTYSGLLSIDPAAFPSPTRSYDPLVASDQRSSASFLVPRSSLTDLSINGLSVYETGLTGKSLSYTRDIELAHDQSSLAFHFSDFNYNHYQQPAYRYYLEGIDKTWHNMTHQNHADYSKLPPGRYTFHLQSLNTDGEWNDETTLSIVIRQPWWNTWWAWTLYLLLIAAAACYVWRNWREKFELHQKMKMDKQLMEFRTSIFTNITHEFRTPLAIIKGAVDKLAADGSNKAALQTAERGTSRLLRLVNQLMEFRKINTSNLRLQVEQGDIVSFVRNIYQDFWVMARQKDIQMTFQPFERHYQTVFDRQMLETIVYNLLSNAVKYTPDGGSIMVYLRLEDAQLKLSVEDTGPGISEKKQAELFKPFMHGYVSQGGMGIGLYTAHQMAQIHKGSLDYNRTETGSRFMLTLPAGDTVYSADDYRDAGAISQESDNNSEQQDRQSEDLIREMQAEAFNDLTVTIIEDNPDMADQLRNEVGVYFKTVCYSTGQAGIDGITANAPALLLCDVMLPDIDGYEIVKRLRACESTASIPVIMLTALDDEAHQIRAYRAGADDYMVKPCNFRLLMARTMQLIKWNRPHTPEPENTPTLVEGHLDKVFKEKLEALVAKHLSDSTFNIDQLAQMMNMGRTKFYGKVKELMGISPNRYLQEERMKRAAELLLQGELTVSEICYKVGIQDPSYFNKCFKAKYGVVPSKYGK